MKKAEIGIIGLGAMGKSLARNFSNNKIPTVVYNRTVETMEDYVKEFGSETLLGAKTLESFVKELEKPRKIILLVKAGKPVDAVIKQLMPLLDKEDIIIDCGNSFYKDTQRRSTLAEEHKLQYLGCGLSGGEEGALKGPSLMPGGHRNAWDNMKPYLEKIAAKDFHGGPCVTYLGDNGAGHFIKMIHNGIEYGIMKAMGVLYEGLRDIYGISAPEIGEVFGQFNSGRHNSFLFEIAADLLTKKDEYKDGYVVDYILDKAAQKGTGTWTAKEALERAIPLSIPTSAVFFRNLSNFKSLREKLQKEYSHESDICPHCSKEEFISNADKGIFAGTIITYGQCLQLIQHTAKEESWDINVSEVLRIWQGGCIIRSSLLQVLETSVKDKKSFEHLFELPTIKDLLLETIPSLRELIIFGIQHRLPTPGLSSGLEYFDGITKGRGAANFTQALRDYFGAHTYQRIDKEGTFHTHWQNY